MKNSTLMIILEQLQNGIISTKEAVNTIGKFIFLNYSLFGLRNLDEDLRSDIILDFLEKSEDMLFKYDNKKGIFFTYLFYYIQNLVHSRKRIKTEKQEIQILTKMEITNTLEEKLYKYQNINYKYFDYPNYKLPIYPEKLEKLKKIFKNVKGDKQILVIAIKSAFYITNPQVEKICTLYKLPQDDFYKTIHYCRCTILKKAERKFQFQKQRNFAYLSYKKYEYKLYNIVKSGIYYTDVYEMELLAEKDKKYKTNWEKINNKLVNDFIAIRPPNRTIAEILGICERQVAYYISLAKKHKEK